MYNTKTGLIVLEIPKNGSRSLVYAAIHGQGKTHWKSQGHHTLKGFLTGQMQKLIKPDQQPTPPVVVAAVVRNPVERLLSQVRQAQKKKANMTLDECMKVCWHQSDIVYKPQWQFLEIPKGWEGKIDLRLWDMTRLDQAQKFVSGGKDFNFTKNEYRGGASATMDELMSHKLYDDIMEKHFGPDFTWWLEGQKTGEDGKR